MIKLKFKIDGRLYITAKHFSNGHWLVTRAFTESHAAPKAFKPLLSMVAGGYHDGIKAGRSTESTPNMEAAIPGRDGYTALLTHKKRAVFRNDSDDVCAYAYLTNKNGVDCEIGISVNYVPLLSMGHAFVRDNMSPILILGTKELDSEFIGLIMPTRLNDTQAYNPIGVTNLLEAAIEYMEAVYKFGGCIIPPKLEPISIKLTAAIAKAEGRSQ